MPKPRVANPLLASRTRVPGPAVLGLGTRPKGAAAVDAWGDEVGALRQAQLWQMLQSRSRANLPLFEQVAAVAAIAGQAASPAAAAERLGRTRGWISKHLTLRRCTPACCPHPYAILRDDLCRDADMAYALCVLEQRAPAQAAALHERLIKETVARRSGQPPARAALTRRAVRALIQVAKLDKRALPAPAPERFATAPQATSAPRRNCNRGARRPASSAAAATCGQPELM